MTCLGVVGAALPETVSPSTHSTISPDANDRHAESDPGDDGLHQLVLQEELDLAADLLAVDLFLQLLAAAVAGSTLVTVRVAEDLVTRLHAPRGPLLLAGLGPGGPLLGRRRARRGRPEDERGDVGRQVGTEEADERGVQQIGVSEPAR